MKIVNLTGQRFGKLIAVKLTTKRTKDKRKIWLCKCDCGGLRETSSKALHDGDTVSCGCLGKLTLGESSFNSLYTKYRKMAQYRDLVFDLTKKQFKELTQGNCFYCATPPAQKIDRPKMYGIYVYNGIDRMVNSIGYTKNNCVSCCGLCNWMKKDLTVKQFLEHAKTIVAAIL